MDTAETAKAVVEKAFLSAGAAEISGEAVQATGSEDVDAAVEERQEEAEEEEELSFGDVPPEPSEGEGSILFGAADDEGGILFGAPDEAPAAVAEPQPQAAAVEEEIVDEGPFEQHCRRLRQPGYPAGELELHALAAMLQCALSFSHRDLFSVPTGLTSRLWLSGRIALYEQQVAQEDAMAPSEVAALGRLEGVLPHISAAYRRAVLIQV